MLPTMLGVCVALLASAGVLIVGLATRPAGGLALPAGYKVVRVEVYDYGIKMPSGALPSGDVVFVLTNRGTVPHELVAFKTKSAEAPMPLRKDKSVDEESDQLEAVVDSGSSLQPGQTRLLSGELEPGSYVAVCNLPEHYQLGMRTPFTVQ